TVIAGNTSQLPIESLTFNNSGDYTCNVKNDYTTISRTEKVSILVYTLLSNVSISLSPDKEIFIENKDTTTLRCTVMGLFPTYSWALDGHPLPVTPRYTLSAANSTLTISPVHRNDSGGFICAASNPVNSDSSKPVKLVITVSIFAVVLKPDQQCNYRWTHNTTVIAGNTSQLPIESLTFNNSGDYTCNVKNDYTTISHTGEGFNPRVQGSHTADHMRSSQIKEQHWCDVLLGWWGADSVLQLKVGQTIVNATNEGNVTITKDQLSSREIFTCVGRHIVSDSQCSIVIDKPQRASGSEPQVEVGKEADVTLDVSLTDTVRVSDPGLLPAHFTWSKEDNSITGSDGKFNITSGPTFSKLLISKFQATDQGTYQCHVTNAMGENFFQFDVTLKGGVNVALIVGTIVGAVAVVVIATLAVLYVYRKRKEAKTQQETEGEPYYETIDVRASSANVSQKDSGPYMDLGKHQKDIYHNLRRNGTRK
ncbi:titin-like, partial [Callorhinchus milii]|uniref:titin-like n=1 Tax=Callorhinchus milii TaxID=7868 RepID=UPI001C3F58C4